MNETAKQEAAFAQIEQYVKATTKANEELVKIFEEHHKLMAELHATIQRREQELNIAKYHTELAEANASADDFLRGLEARNTAKALWNEQLSLLQKLGNLTYKIDAMVEPINAMRRDVLECIAEYCNTQKITV